MPRILVIGYGNPLRTDDGIGWRAAEDLSHRMLSPQVEVLVRFQLTPEIADDIQRSDAVIFIDAVRDGEPGELRFERIKAQVEPAGFSHELSPSALLELCQRVYHRQPAAFMISLCGECFDHGEGLSSKAEASFPRLTALVNQLTSSKLS